LKKYCRKSCVLNVGEIDTWWQNFGDGDSLPVICVMPKNVIDERTNATKNDKYFDSPLMASSMYDRSLCFLPFFRHLHCFFSSFRQKIKAEWTWVEFLLLFPANKKDYSPLNCKLCDTH